MSSRDHDDRAGSDNDAPAATVTPFAFGAAATVCVAEVPTIRITFLNRFPELAGQSGTLTMRDINGNVVSTQSLVYEPGYDGGPAVPRYQRQPGRVDR